MVIVIFGESCTGKSTIAEALKQQTGARVFSGKDYLRLAKNEKDAERVFQELLTEHVKADECLIFVLSETELLRLIPQGALRVLATADLAVIQARFSARMHGNLPAPVTAMLERKHGCFDGEPHDVHVNGNKPLDKICKEILSFRKEPQ